jgi:hypothetical protein
MERLNELIYAYSLGCLTPSENDKFLDYINNDDFNFHELGEYQNLAALLPAILTMEVPDPHVKNSVARKLYRLKDEIRTRRKRNKLSSIKQENDKVGSNLGDNKTHSSPGFPEIEFPPKMPPNGDSNESDMGMYQYNSTPEFTSNPEDSLVPKEKVQKSSWEGLPYSLPDMEPKVPPLGQKKNRVIINVMLGFILILLIAGIVSVYLNITQKTTHLNNDIEKLQKELNILKQHLSSSSELQEIIESKNVQVINLDGADYNKNDLGKILISPDKEMVYLLWPHIPHIPIDKVFQIWAGASGNFTSLGTLRPSDKLDFYSFRMRSFVIDEDISFLITEEPEDGSKIPGKVEYLFGSYNP